MHSSRKYYLSCVVVGQKANHYTRRNTNVHSKGEFSFVWAGTTPIRRERLHRTISHCFGMGRETFKLSKLACGLPQLLIPFSRHVAYTCSLQEIKYGST